MYSDLRVRLRLGNLISAPNNVAYTNERQAKDFVQQLMSKVSWLGIIHGPGESYVQVILMCH